MTDQEILLPDRGEDGYTLTLKLPTGERIDVMYKGYYGSLDVCIYEPEEGGEFEGFRPKVCEVANYTDKWVGDKRVDSLHPAPPVDGVHYRRKATQLVIAVGPSRDLEEE